MTAPARVRGRRLRRLARVQAGIDRSADIRSGRLRAPQGDAYSQAKARCPHKAARAAQRWRLAAARAVAAVGPPRVITADRRALRWKAYEACRAGHPR